VAPISIILTTLAAKAYEECVLGNVYDSEIDLLLDVVRVMPSTSEWSRSWSRTDSIPNETTAGENFADKWNQDARLPEAFYTWHGDVSRRLQEMLDDTGLDVLGKNLSESFGEAVAGRILGRYTQRLSSARDSGRLAVLPTLGLRRGLPA